MSNYFVLLFMFPAMHWIDQCWFSDTRDPVHKNSVLLIPQVSAPEVEEEKRGLLAGPYLSRKKPLDRGHCCCLFDS